MRRMSGCAVKQLARLGGAEHPCGRGGPPTDAEVSQAKHLILHEFQFVGIADLWDKSLCLWHHMGDRVTCPPLTRDIPRTVYNTSLLNGWDDRWDRALYQVARQRFDTDFTASGLTDAGCSRWRSRCKESERTHTKIIASAFEQGTPEYV